MKLKSKSVYTMSDNFKMGEPMEPEVEELNRHIAVLEEENPEAILYNGFNDAIIGVGRRCGQPALAIYSTEKCIEILMERDGMSYEDAIDYFSFNVEGGWLGENTPIIMG